MERFRSLMNDQYITAEEVREKAGCPKCSIEVNELCVDPNGSMHGKKGKPQNHRERVRAALAEKRIK